MLFYENFLIILGKKNSSSNQLPIEVFDTESAESFQFKKLTMNRHTSFIFNKDIFFFGEFHLKNNVSLGVLYKISLDKIFSDSLNTIISKKNIEKSNSTNKKIN